MDLRCGTGGGNLGDSVFVDDINGLNIVLIEYLRALTDVCKLGILLAGRLDRQLQSKVASHIHQQNCSRALVDCVKLDRKQMTHIGSFYSGIMGKLGPLWEQTIYENGEENTCCGYQLSEQQYLVSDYFLSSSYC